MFNLESRIRLHPPKKKGMQGWLWRSNLALGRDKQLAPGIVLLHVTPGTGRVCCLVKSSRISVHSSVHQGLWFGDFLLLSKYYYHGQNSVEMTYFDTALVSEVSEWQFSPQGSLKWSRLSSSKSKLLEKDYRTAWLKVQTKHKQEKERSAEDEKWHLHWPDMGQVLCLEIHSLFHVIARVAQEVNTVYSWKLVSEMMKNFLQFVQQVKKKVEFLLTHNSIAHFLGKNLNWPH